MSTTTPPRYGTKRYPAPPIPAAELCKLIAAFLAKRAAAQATTKQASK